MGGWNAGYFVGVVPIFVNTGLALIPAILVGIVSIVGLLFRPRELVRRIRERPFVAACILLAAVGSYFPLSWALSSKDDSAGSSKARDPKKAEGTAASWADVALEKIRQQERDLRAAFLEERARRQELEATVEKLRRRLDELSAGRREGEGAAVATIETTSPQTATIYRGGVSRCGAMDDGSPRKLRPLWEYTEENTMILSSPLVVGDTVFCASCLLDPPDNYGGVFALDVESGEERWYTDIATDPATNREREFKAFFSSPAVTADGKYLVIGQGLHLDTRCALICLETETGKVHWTLPTPLHIEGSPAIEGDIVVAGAGAVEGKDLKPRGDPGFVFAVRISDGTLLWKYAVNDPESSPAIQDGIVTIGSGLNGSAVVALRLASDEELKRDGLERLVWKTSTPHPAVGAVTLWDDLVLVGCGNSNYVVRAREPEGMVMALDRATGEVRWTRSMPDAVLGAIAVRDGKAVCAALNGEVALLDLARSGQVLWQRRIREHSLLKASPAFTGSHIYLVTHDGYLTVLEAKGGAIVEQHYINSARQPGEMGLSTSSPFVAGDRVYVGSETGGLKCLIGESAR